MMCLVLVSPTSQLSRISQYQRVTRMWPVNTMMCTQLQMYATAMTVMFGSVASVGHGRAVVVLEVVGLYI